jgi:hypothetical protein
MTEYPETRVWEFSDCPFSFECARSVLDQINAEVADAFYSVPMGGAEVGGVLYGLKEGLRVRILMARPLECEHAFGPCFRLSPNDFARLSARVRQPQIDPLLAGMTVVGWYHSHTRSDIGLTDADRAIHREFFNQPWQLALVLRPTALHPTRVGVFQRRSDSSVVPNGEHLEFPLPRTKPARPGAETTSAGPVGRTVSRNGGAALNHPLQPRRQPRQHHGRLVGRPPGSRRRWALGAAENGRHPEVQPAATPNIRPAPRPSTRRAASRLLKWSTLALALGLGTAAALFVAAYIPVGRPLATPAALSVRAMDRDGQLHIAWDRGPAADVVSGFLQIKDGDERKAFVLDREFVDAGSIDYPRRSDLVSVSLTLVRKDGSRLRGSTNLAADGRAASRQPGSLENVAASPGPDGNPEVSAASLPKTTAPASAVSAPEPSPPPLKQETTSTEPARSIVPDPPGSLESVAASRGTKGNSEVGAASLPETTAAASAVPARAASRQPGPLGNVAASPGPEGHLEVSAASPPKTTAPANAVPAPSPSRSPVAPETTSDQSTRTAAKDTSTALRSSRRLRPFQPPPRPSQASASPPPAFHSAHVPMDKPAVLPATAALAGPAPTAAGVKQPSISGYWKYRRVPAAGARSIAVSNGAARLPSGGSRSPQSVELFISNQDGEVFGSLIGRYRAPRSSSVDPEVRFTFRGPARSGSMRFPWTGTGRSKGEIELIRLSPDTMRIVWYPEERSAVVDHTMVRIYSY